MAPVMHTLAVGGKCRSGRHVILTEDDIYREPKTGYARCKRCFRANRARFNSQRRTIETIEPRVEVVPASQIPPPLQGRVEDCEWERVVRRAALLMPDETLKVTRVGVQAEASIRKASRRAGIPVKVINRGGVLWVLKKLPKRKGRIA